MNLRLLAGHHLHFLSKHRGRREGKAGITYIHSDKPDFNIAYLLAPAGLAGISPDFQIYLPDFVEINEEEFARHQWKRTGSFSTMVLKNGPEHWRANPEVEVQQMETAEDIERFSLVQAKGFSESEVEFKDYHPWMLEKNLGNFQDNNQSFYMGFLNGKPAGVCLTLFYQKIAGIYAVTSLPEVRKNGVSTSVMKKAVEGALAKNADNIILQTITGSYAEQFYLKMGFEKAFSCGIYQKPLA